MTDLEIILENKPGELARLGEALFAAGVSIEGGGAWGTGKELKCHFLFNNAQKAVEALSSAGIKVVKENKVLVQKLKQDQPGQLGKITRRMSDAGVNIEVLYSDHYNQLILVVDKYTTGKEISDTWKKEYIWPER